jgi:hypothetical protein
MPRWPWAPTLARQVVGAAADQSVAWSATLSNANQQAIGTERREPGYSLGYCGPAPVPGQLTWNADPILAVCLLIIAALYAWRGRRLPGSRQLVFWCGWIPLTARTHFAAMQSQRGAVLCPDRTACRADDDSGALTRLG